MALNVPIEVPSGSFSAMLSTDREISLGCSFVS
jgi:hypothetical protein